MKRITLSPWLTLLLAGCSAGCVNNRITTLNDSLEPLRSQFNAEQGKPRLIAFFSPT